MLASQAEKIREVNEELQTKRNGCEAARNSTVLQAEMINLLRSSLATAMSTPDLKTIENLKTVLEKVSTVEEHMSELTEGLGNLTSALRSATVNMEIVDQQAEVIQNQGKSIAQLIPLLRHTNKGTPGILYCYILFLIFYIVTL